MFNTMSIKKIGKAFLWGLIFLLAIGLGLLAFLYATRDAQAPIIKNPFELQADSKNKGIRCPAKHWDSISDSPLCYPLQERLDNAVYNGDLSEMSNSLREGANVAGSYYQSEAPIVTATMMGQTAAAKLLIENGAEVNYSGKWRTSALQIAASYKHPELTKLLIENGADVCHIAWWDDGSLPTALDIAVKNRDYALIRLLVSNGALFCGTQYVPNSLIEYLRVHSK